ncbi:beta-1,3-N-acetylglucosaminyltransferase radical fringe [Paramormyrops kingsleyae]|uniref:O-fucosylpeptide 3-beta-N-acetylglucosaminyltransferase n=1 Tax=Paramormyrops kingsleyae TaxID=1676925 RepID=A0A3B3RYA7_9TELE|nr:beta-1,3-N-acetylglucosaminyltransferase radical fringe-like [Paramormyrops kingsleyae]XP_023646451.1 beta-1,3-N-acetylglucosaminyltransferase radical fringe-like [Paramormyrops kingsleyae]
MLFSRVGVSKLCFLLSLAFCAFLLLLIPGLQLPLRHVEIPKPRPHSQSPAGDAGRPGQLLGLATGLHLNIRASAAGDTGATPPSRTLRSGEADSSSSAVGSGGTFARNGQNSLQALDGDARRAGPVRSHLRDQLQLGDIFIAVKTTKKYHKSRLDLLFQTWVSKAKEQTFIFTDGEDGELRRKAGDNVINTNCSAAHTRQALCCKMSVEYDKFIESQKKWFCHVDDDNYVILPSLLRLLQAYSHTQDVYLGRPSLDHPIEAAERVKSDGSVSVKFWFATGGAGFCISRGLALKMSPWASLGNFISTAEKIRLPDDCTIGYIIEALLEVSMTHTWLFHSHLENLQRLPANSVLRQVTLSYGGYENRRNVVSIGGGFSLAEDPSRFKTVHCLLYPDTNWCPSKKRP